jgi:hypothetical protein
MQRCRAFRGCKSARAWRRQKQPARAITCSREEYERRIRPVLQGYAACCGGQGDQVRAQIARKAVEELDGRFNFAG